MSDLIKHLYQSLGKRIRHGPALGMQRHGKCRFPFKMPEGITGGTIFLHGIIKRPFDT